MIRKITLLAGALIALGVSVPAVSSAAKPTVSTGGASQVATTTARLNGSVNPQGQSTTYSFQYGTSTKYGASSAAGSAGSGTKGVAAIGDIGGLTGNTVYHYRIVASSPGGVVSGADRSFRTAKVPLSLVLLATPNPIPFGSATTLSGQLAGTGGGGRTLQLQEKSFPYTSAFVNAPISPIVTAADGSFSIPFAGLMTNTLVQITTTTGQKLTSAPVLVGVSPKVRTAVSTTHPRRRTFVRFVGTVTPSFVPAQVAIQRKASNGAWITVAGVVTKSGGSTHSTYAKSARISSAGTYRVFVGLPDSKYAPSTGPEIRITPRSK